jgi:hypothetical protein
MKPSVPRRADQNSPAGTFCVPGIFDYITPTPAPRRRDAVRSAWAFRGILVPFVGRVLEGARRGSVR